MSGGFGSGGIAGAKSNGGGYGSGGVVHPGGASRGPQMKPKKGGGGILGSIGHFIGSKAGLAAHDIAAMPGGIYYLAKTSAQPSVDLLHGRSVAHAQRSERKTDAAVGAIAKSTYESLRHPLRDPFQTALTVAPIVGTVGKIGEGGIAAADAARAGEGAAAAARVGGKALIRRGAPPTRLLHVGEDQTPVGLLASKNAGVRLAQRGYDRMVQRALDREAAGQQVGRATARVAKHGMKRAAGALAEEQRIEQKLRLIPADMLDRSAHKLFKTPGTRRSEQAALELTSTQTPPELAAAYHYGQAAKGVNKEQNIAVAKLYEGVARRHLVHVDETKPAGAKVFVNPAHQRLAAVDRELARVQKRGDAILAKHEQMTPEQLQARADAPGRIRAGATYEKPTPAKTGIPSAKLEFRRAEVARLQAASDRAAERVQRMRFTAADQKRIGNGASRPVDAIALRQELGPLDKQLRQLTEEWNTPAKAGGSMTQAEAEARLAELDKRYQDVIDRMVPMVSPYVKETQRVFHKKTRTWSEREYSPEQNRRNTLGGKGGKYGKMKTVKQEEHDLAEAKLHELVTKHPDKPVIKDMAALVHEREHLTRILTQRAGADIMGEHPEPLPSTGGKSPYEERAQLHRILRKGTSAEKQVKDFAAAAGTDSTVHGLNDLKEQAAELTDRINELRGKPGPEIKALRREIAGIRKAIRDAEGPKSRVIAGERPHVITAAGEIVRPIGANHAERIGSALSVAKDRLQQAEAAAARREKPTGIVGGEEAFPGRGFVSERVSQKRLARAEAASARTKIVGEARPPIDKKPYTGRAVEQGLRPKNVTGAASQHYRQIARFEATDALRRRAISTGSTVRRSNRDVLIRVPGEEGGKVGAQTREILGLEKSTVDTPEELAAHNEDVTAKEEGLAVAHQMFAQKILDKVKESKTAGIGVKADPGYRWVDENTIKGLQDEARPKGGPGAGLGRAVDNVNSAVTAMTVYFKVGHVGTRVLTNAATNIMQGSAGPLGVGKSIRLWEALSPEDKARMLAAAGQHGFSALPHEGSEGLAGRAIAGAAKGGARFWARHADAPFRFNGLAYELRKAGYTTPADVRRALDGLESGGHGLPAHEWSKISAAARRADRELIAYDRLNPFEKRYLTRGIWFYPWVKGSTVFTVRSILEHPFKAAALGALGAEGRKRQEQLLGDVPSYEEGLVPLSGGKHPLTTDFSTFSPFSTAGQLLNIPRIPGSLAQQFNPAAGAAGQFIYGLNQYGAPSKNPYRDALLALAAATPEQQFAEAYAGRHADQSKRMFHKTPGSTALRFLIGPGYPRRVNRAALARAAKRERSGQR